MKTARVQQHATGFERIVFLAVDLWVRLRFRRQYREIRRRLAKQGVRPSPAFPRCAADKGLWRRVFDRDPRLTITSDKIAAKDWVNGVAPDIEVASVLWEGTSASDLPRELLQTSCVVKTNHGWRSNIFVSEGNPPYDEVVSASKVNLAIPHGKTHHEWGYFGIERKLFIEEVVADGSPLTDMKIHTVGSEIVYFLCLRDRFGEGGRCYWEPDGKGGWQPAELEPRDGSKRDETPLPESAPKALAFARQLGAHFDYMRVDLMTDGQRVWFGELTAYPGGGKWPEIEHLSDHPLNTGWDLTQSWFLSSPKTGWRGIYADALRSALRRQSAP